MAAAASSQELTGEPAQGIRAVSATTLSGMLVTAQEGIHRHAAETSSITSRTIRAPRAIGHDGFHCTVGVLDRLRTVGVGDELGLGRAVRVLNLLARRVARLHSMGWNVPLRHARGELDKVILLARAIPLRNPAGGEIRRGIRGTLGAGGGRAGHGRQKLVSRRSRGFGVVLLLDRSEMCCE